VPRRIDIDDFLAQRHLAFVGVSTDARQFANAVYRRLRAGGRTLYPVNRSTRVGDEIEGDAAFQSLRDVPDPVGGVVVMVATESAAGVVRDAIERGVPRVWLHRGVGRGSVSVEAVSWCRHNGVVVIDGACPLMFEEPVSALHALHRLLAQRRVLRRTA